MFLIKNSNNFFFEFMKFLDYLIFIKKHKDNQTKNKIRFSY